MMANPVIRVIGSTRFTNRQSNAESQIVLSAYALAMLGICKRYYNSTRFWEAMYIDYIIEILREVYEISYSSNTKDECDEFIKKLENEKNYLAPYSVHIQANEIRIHIEAFCKKPNETRWSDVLLNNCVQSLREIRKKLGSDNLYYKRISSQIANNALYACEDEIERIDEIVENLFLGKKEIIRLAVQLCANIKALETDDTFNASNFKKLVRSLDSLCKKYHEKTVDETDASFCLSEDDFIRSHQDYDSLVRYLQDNPHGLYAATAKRRITEIEDEEYPKTETTEALFAYKEKYPNSVW